MKKTSTAESTEVAKPPKRSVTWLFNKTLPSLSTQNLSKSLNKLNKSGRGEEEREWLLLDGVQSHNEDEKINAESSILSDVDCIAETENNATESSSSDEEDIDSIVEEFQQKLKISAAGLKDINLSIPTTNSWRCSLIGVALIILSSVLSAVGFSIENYFLFFTSILAILLANFASMFIPKYTYSYATPSTLTCSMAIFSSSILLSSITFDSWFAIIFWLISGIILVLSTQSIFKCDVFCCFCLDFPHDEMEATIVVEEHLGAINANGLPTTTINLRNPPKGMSIINHVQRS